MIAYEISATHPHRHFISFRAIFPVEGRSTIPIKIAAWRPGRYELGNFSKNIRAWRATDAQGEPLSFTKSDKDTWQVQCEGKKEIVVHYQYYASELNAGSSYLDETQLYINPVNCFFYDGDHLQQDYDLRFRLPDDYDIACQLTSRGPHHLYAHSFDELADSPLIASPSLTKHEYRAGDIPFYLHAQGPWNMDTSRLLSDFRAFSTLQIDIFGSIPCSKYDFLYQFPPYFVRHGVEHSASTVIAMGPASELGGEKLYNELLAISCHELFHTWNIKCIRPAAMLPYDFSKENYSPLGYVYEGVTTYYGDLVLLRCGVWSRERWLATFSDEVKTHLENPGIFNHSVSDSSMDTWLDGYGQGIPWRKVSIYTEGCLAAFMCDIMIMRATHNRASLDDVMRLLYSEFGLRNRGYSAEDYIGALEKIAGISFASFAENILNQAGSYKHLLDECLDYIGCTLRAQPSGRTSEAAFGFGIDESSGKAVVTWIEPEGPADKAGLWMGDEITAVNGTAATRSVQALLAAGKDQPMTLTVNKKMRMCELSLSASTETVRWNYTVVRSSVTSDAQNSNWEYFCSQR